MTKVITIGNFKGGVGKTTTSCLFSYLLAETKRKVLLVDFDPQGNASEIMKKTYPKIISSPKNEFMNGLKLFDLSQSVTKFTDYFDMLVSDWSLSAFPDMLEEYRKDDRKYLLDKLLSNIKNDYDFVLIDIPPTLSNFVNNAVLASDYIIGVLQTQEQAYSSTLKFISYLQDLTEYESHFDLLGIIQYLVKIDGRVDQEIIKDASESLGPALFHENIYQRERVKRFGRSGIKNNDLWDKRVLHMYKVILDEALTRMEK
ncbi:ParA family protein [Lactiplantibacillus plantarum]|uniref:ParA family protein n=1 Tax=Lactiplantibacillus plantarum TaxID=1590 RepID=UPI0028FC2076|nr:ParA family protein [Lactiplantibacillus plantarum]WNW17341.1 ParA family protein [Lactiplantibacillus plantarum]WNW20333.1 ParA family protein [Lactiplantibacillus plantarum]